MINEGVKGVSFSVVMKLLDDRDRDSDDSELLDVLVV